MKGVLIAAALIGLMAPAFAADTPGDKAEQEIRARAQQFVDAWAKHDAHVLSEFYAPDGDLVLGNGRSYGGRDAIEQMLHDAFDDSLKDSTFSWTVEKVKLVKGDVAIVDYDAQIKTADANAEPMKFHVVSVLTRDGDKWLAQTTRSVEYTQ